MRPVSISVTEAARSFADCVNRVRYQGAAFILHKNGVAVARLVPFDNNPKEKNELSGTSNRAKLVTESQDETQAGVNRTRPAPIPEIW